MIDVHERRGGDMMMDVDSGVSFIEGRCLIKLTVAGGRKGLSISNGSVGGRE